MVPPKDQRYFENVMRTHNMEAQVYIDNVQELMTDKQEARRFKGAYMQWDRYLKINEIHDWLDSLGEAYPGIVEVVSAGASFEDRDLKGVKISFGAGRRSVFIEAGIHAREWISPATATYLINELLTSQDPRFRKVAESFDWHIFPSVNPDGYVHSDTSYRLWRKTRQPFSVCVGTDANRNWDFHWAEEGASNVQCSETYHGPSAFSEPETDGLSKYITSIASSLDVYLSFHSYGQYLLIPYGHTIDHLDNYDDLRTIATATAEALAERENTWYTYGNTVEVLYKASGSSVDWVKGTYQVPITFTFEFRDTGRFGFLLPSSQIVPNCLEVMDGLMALFEKSEELGYFELRN